MSSIEIFRNEVTDENYEEFEERNELILGQGSLYDEVSDIFETCKSVSDYKAAVLKLANKADEINELLIALETAIQRKSGDDKVDEYLLEATRIKRASREELFEIAREKIAKYGYTKGDMIDISLKDAEEMFKKNKPIHLLMKDDTERIATSFDEIQNHFNNNGILGISEKEMHCFVDNLRWGIDIE